MPLKPVSYKGPKGGCNSVNVLVQEYYMHKVFGPLISIINLISYLLFKVSVLFQTQ